MHVSSRVVPMWYVLQGRHLNLHWGLTPKEAVFDPPPSLFLLTSTKKCFIMVAATLGAFMPHSGHGHPVASHLHMAAGDPQPDLVPLWSLCQHAATSTHLQPPPKVTFLSSSQRATGLQSDACFLGRSFHAVCTPCQVTCPPLEADS